MTRLPTHDDVVAAAERLKGVAVRTPLLASPVLDAMTGARVFLKPECLQRTGSFKFRGAWNAISQIPPADRPKGVVACSSGNHAQGVAEAARLLGVAATILMPADAPALKIARTKRSGAAVVTYDRAREDREALTVKLAAESGGDLVHPFDDARVIAGQGTIGLEIVEDLAALGLVPDLVLAPASGGGLASGIALGLERGAPAARVVMVEPAGFDDQARSLAEGRRVANPVTSGSICDALLSPTPGEITFAVNRARGSIAVAVSDEEAMAAMAFAAI
ncbi:MAG: threonine/serine dehydratase, partial [Siculibacillus sp.]|nr:threonine/serine dehydratase [Siculibacillus sp.]